MTAKEVFVTNVYEKISSALNDIPVSDRADIYAISFWHDIDEDDLRYQRIMVGYNTLSNFQGRIKSASSESEAKWNFAFWLQNVLTEVGGVDEPLLSAWFAESPYYFSDEENEASCDDDELFDELGEKGAQFEDEFMGEIITATQRLFREGVISQVFGRDIPVLIHELEYYDAPAGWTLRANPPGLADEFLEWVDIDSVDEA